MWNRLESPPVEEHVHKSVRSSAAHGEHRPGQRNDGKPEGKPKGIPPAQVASETLTGLNEDRFEIVVGEASGLATGSRTNFERVFERLNRCW